MYNYYSPYEKYLDSNGQIKAEVLREFEDKMLENLRLLKDKKLPKSYPNMPLLSTPYYSERYGKEIYLRRMYTREVGFPLYAENWVKPLARWIGDRPCLEIMAGTGHLSYFLSQYGVKSKATDDYSWNDLSSNQIIPIENLDAVSAIQKYGKYVKFIICSWPPYGENSAYEALMEMRRVNPKCRMIYIGEFEDGCTANNAFIEAMEIEELITFYDAVAAYRQWDTIHDFISLVK